MQVNVRAVGLTYYSTETDFQSGVLYLVATNDYIFDKPDYPFVDGVQPTNTEIILRDLVEAELLLQSTIFDEFLLLNQIQTTN